MLLLKGNGLSTPSRGRARALVVLGLVAALSVVAGTNANPASAYDIGWPSWLDRHPQLTVTQMPKGFITGPAAQVAKAATSPAGALAAGAFVLGYEGTTAFLNWQYGPAGDDRSTQTVNGECTGPNTVGWCHGLVMPPASMSGPSFALDGIGIATASGQNATLNVKTRNKITGTISHDGNNGSLLDYTVTSYDSGGCGCPRYYIGVSNITSTHEFAEVTLDVPVGTDFRWAYDPPREWTVNVTQHCATPGGSPTSVSLPYTITPVADATAELEVPACPSGYEAEAVSLDGGRTGETGILVAIPQTRTQEAEVTPPPPNTDPVDPVPGTIGAGTTVTNPDGSTTVTQTQTLPDGTTRTVTTTTYPDGSKTITTQPLNPDGTPNGSPAVVNIPAPGTGSEPGTEGETSGCMGSWTWNPVAWVYRPIKCALQWAFVPRTSVMTTATDNVIGSWNTTAPAVVMDAVGDLVAPATSLQDNPELDCLGPGFTFHIWDDPWTMHPFSACGTFAAWVSSVTLPIETFLVWFAALFVGARLVMRTVGMDTPDSGAS